MFYLFDWFLMIWIKKQNMTDVPCPRCGAEHTTLKSQFGFTACKSSYLCGDCKEPFDYLKDF